MSKGNTAENDFLLLMLNNTGIALVGDATGIRPSSAAGSLYAALHSADPGEAGDQTTSELSFTGYARVVVARTTGGFTVSGNQGSNTAAVTFPTNTGTTQTARFWSIGVASSGASKILWRGNLGAALPLVFTGNVSDTLTAPGHTFAVSDEVVFYSIPGSTLPTGITEGTVYFVKTSSGDTLTISATDGGATIDVTVSGAGIVAKIVKKDISNNEAVNFPIGQMVIAED